MKFTNFLSAILGLNLLILSTFAQIRMADPVIIDEDQQFIVDFHQPVLNNQGKMQRVSGTDTVKVGNALSESEIKGGFKVNDLIVIRFKAPVDSYVYAVNNSQWDGSFLVAKGEMLKAGVEKDFIYKLTNNQGINGVGAEELMFLIRRTPFSDSELNSFLIKDGNKLPKIKLVGTTTEETKIELKEFKAKTKGGGFVKVTCNVASIFFPWIGRLCRTTGFSAATPVALPGNETGLQPESSAENMVVQFSFPVKP